MNFRIVPWFLLITLLVLAACGTRQTPRKASQKAFEELVEAERAFSRASMEQGMKQAFMAWLSDSALVFSPVPRNGKEVHASSPDVPGLLSWRPQWAVVSADGNLGFVSGPWAFGRSGAPADSLMHGHFVSVWKREKAGWRVILDGGITHPAMALSSDKIQTCRGSAAPADSGYADALAALQRQEQAFNKIVREKDLHAALEQFAHPEVICNLWNRIPQRGLEAAAEALSAYPGIPQWNTSQAEVAASRELGYTWGYLVRNGSGKEALPDSSSYLRLWRTNPQGQWKLCLELENSLHPQ